jgi:hypothetical protein
VVDAPGVTVYLSGGVFRYTTALTVPEGVSIQGDGRASVLKPEGCDGLVFDTSDYIGPQVFEGFYLHGNGYTYTGVKALGDANSGRVQGITFQDVYLSNFKTGFWLRSAHGWHLSHVTGTYLWEGVKVAGQTILLTLDGGCEFSRDSATGTGSSTGMKVMSVSDYNPGGVTEQGPEGIRVRDTTFFGFAVGVDHVTALDSVYTGLTLGLVSDTAFKITSTPGGLRLRDSWIGYDDSADYGVHAVALGAANDSTIIIEGVHSAVESGKTADANSIGCAIDSNQSNVTVRDNTWTGNRLHDVRLNFAGKCTLADNKCLSATSGASIQLVAFPGGPYHLQRNVVATNVFEHASNTDRTVASAATITVPPIPLVNVTGTTTITSVTAGQPQQVVTLKFAGVLTFTDGSNLKLNGNFTTSADDTITLVCDGTSWFEVARSAN